MKNLWVSLKALISDPLNFLRDPSYAVIAYQVKEMQAQGATMAEIDQSLSDAGLKKGPGPAMVIWNGAVNTIGFATKHLPSILLVAALLIAGWYIFVFFRMVKS